MSIIVHHQSATNGLSWDAHIWQNAWSGNAIWNSHGTVNNNIVDFQLPNVADPRRFQFKYRSTDSTGFTTWESDDYIRRVTQTVLQEVWTFDFSGRVLYQSPFPPDVVFHPRDELTFYVITQNRFRGGQLYVWNPYDPDKPFAYFPQTARDDAAFRSTFTVPLMHWMTAGFHLKLMNIGSNDKNDVWEPNSSTRVWRPCDGNSLWLKSGQNDLRSQPLELTTLHVKMLLPATLPNLPGIVVQDVVEDVKLPFAAASVMAVPGTDLFKIATYHPQIYPGAGYLLSVEDGYESQTINRPFPANPANVAILSQFTLGAGAWVNVFPPLVHASLFIQPSPNTTFTDGVSVQVSIGNALTAYQTVQAQKQADNTWKADIIVAPNTTAAIVLLPMNGSEPKPYDWIDIRRFFTPGDQQTKFFTTEGVYGISAHCQTQFEDLTNRKALMEAAFGEKIVASGIFAEREVPYGVTLLDPHVYFVVHAPHAVCADLILVDEAAPEGPARQTFAMHLTSDRLYWWTLVPAEKAPADTRYRFLLNGNLEVMDPAARAVLDRGDFSTSFGDNPQDPITSWSRVLDGATVLATAHAQPWQTMGWENFLIYELHATRFTNLDVGGLTPLDVLVDELKLINRRQQHGYFRQLPITVFELMPISEFSSVASWGYDPAFYFAIDEFYGGAQALARFMQAAHENSRGVMADVVYNHSLSSPLMRIAPDVYRNGDYDGDRMNCGHPMVGEFLRQATIYLWRTFGLDGFRFDDTQTIDQDCQGGWQFLGMLRASLRTAATAEGLAWPYCVAENAKNGWDISDSHNGVLDGQWGIDEVYRIRAASYDSQHPGWDDSTPLQNAMESPNSWGHPFSQAVRFGESHDMVSAQDAMNLRIAARPPFGQGLQMAKALGTLTLLSNGVPLLFMGQEIGATQSFSFGNTALAVNPQQADLPPEAATENTQVLSWFRSLMGLRNDSTQGLQGDTNYQVIRTGNRTLAMTCGSGQRLFVVITFGTPNNQQDSSWLGLPIGAAYKEIVNSSWPAYQVEKESEQSNGGYQAQISSGHLLNIPTIGAVILQRIEP